MLLSILFLIAHNLIYDKLGFRSTWLDVSHHTVGVIYWENEAIQFDLKIIKIDAKLIGTRY